MNRTITFDVGTQPQHILVPTSKGVYDPKTRECVDIERGVAEDVVYPCNQQVTARMKPVRNRKGKIIGWKSTKIVTRSVQ